MSKTCRPNKSGTGSTRALLECFRALENAEATSENAHTENTEAESPPTVPPADQIQTPPQRPLKRSRDADESESNSSSEAASSSNTAPVSFMPVSEASPSPTKRQKRESDNAPSGSNSTPGPAQTVRKKVRFHPSTIDNWLWADLHRGKYNGEEESSPAEEEENATQDTAATLAAAPTPKPTSGLPGGPFSSRREICSERARAFLEKRSWKNDFVFVDRTSDDEPDSDDDTLSSHLDDDERWPKDDLDDVSIPCSSPPPSLRVKALGLSATESSRLEDALRAEKEREAKRVLPPLYTHPIRDLVHLCNGSPPPRSVAEDPASQWAGSPPPQVKISRQMKTFLTNTLEKLPSEDKQAVWDALKTITTRSYREGFVAGINAHALHIASTQTEENASTT